MKLTVLGSAAGYMPKGQPFRFPACHLVETNGMRVLFDFGIGAMPQLAKLGLTVHDIDVVVITHFHHDHFDVGPLMQALFLEGKITGQKSKITFVGPVGLVAACKQVFDVSFSFENDFLANTESEFIEVDNQKVDLSNSVVLQGFPTKHYELEARSFRLESEGKVFAYSGDSTDSAGVREASLNADLFLCEAVILEEENDDGHFSARGAGVVAKSGNVKHLVFTHYSGIQSDQEMTTGAQKSGYKGKISISQDLSTYEI